MSKDAAEVATKERVAYFVMETVRDENGQIIALIAREGEKGYYRTDWKWGKNFSEAVEIADTKNERMGVSKKEALEIVLSSMRA